MRVRIGRGGLTSAVANGGEQDTVPRATEGRSMLHHHAFVATASPLPWWRGNRLALSMAMRDQLTDMVRAIAQQVSLY